MRSPCATHLVVLCRTKEEAERVLHYLQEWTSAAGLTLHRTKTRIVEAGSEGFDFLGWHFRGGKKWPRKKSLQKLREKLRPLTRRTNGRSLSEIVAQVNPILRGWLQYYGRYYRSALYPYMRQLDRSLAHWAYRKYKKLRGHLRRATHWVARISRRDSKLFAHWQMGVRRGSMAGAV